MIYLYSRPDVPSLDLDLVELEGGGSCPAQFYGRTTDDRPIFIRYRGGWLSIDRGAPGEPRGYSPTMETLLDAAVGPPLHGDILLEQVCELTGMTIRGKKLTLSEEELERAREEAPYLDFSGRRTYLECDAWVSADGGPAFLEALAGAFHDARIFELEWNTGDYRPHVATTRLQPPGALSIGVGGQIDTVGRLLSSTKVTRADLDGAFAHIVSIGTHEMYGSAATDAEISAKLGRSVRFFDGQHWSIRTDFTTNDTNGRAFVDRLVTVIGSCFDDQLEHVDLASGVTVEIRQSRWLFSRDLVDWCRAAPDRYIGGYKDSDQPSRFVGTRPAST
jgi:hypothetical protein